LHPLGRLLALFFGAGHFFLSLLESRTRSRCHKVLPTENGPAVCGRIPKSNLTVLPAPVLPLAAAVTTITTAATTVFFRPGLVDIQRPAVEFPAIQSGNGPFAFTIIAHFHESKASGPSGVAVGDDADTIHRAICFKQGANGIFGGPEAQISYEYILHFLFFLKFAASKCGQDRRSSR
jgi:hypothetical protein